MQSQRNMCQSTLCQALGQCWRAKTTGERKMTDKRRRRACNIFLNTSVRPKPHPLSGKPFLASQCQMSTCPNVRCRGGGRGGSHARHVCLTPHARSQVIDISVDVNCQNWPIIGYTKRWHPGIKNVSKNELPQTSIDRGWTGWKWMQVEKLKVNALSGKPDSNKIQRPCLLFSLRNGYIFPFNVQCQRRPNIKLPKKYLSIL